MGGLLASYRPGQVHLLRTFQLFPGRSGLGRNSVGSTYRGLGRERTALRALIFRTSSSYLGSGFTIGTRIPACACFRRAYRARALCVARPLLPRNFKLSR